MNIIQSNVKRQMAIVHNMPEDFTETITSSSVSVVPTKPHNRDYCQL